MNKLKVLVTGTQGRIGPHFTVPWKDRYDLRTLDIKADPADPTAFYSNLQDVEGLKRAMQGMDVVVHLAATSDEAPFIENLVPNNIVGLYNTYQAAIECGVRRIVFASTVQAISNGLHSRENVSATAPPRPNTHYGATKVFGEVLGRMYHDKYGLEFVAIRIGYFLPYDSEVLKGRKHMDIWLSPRDAIQLFQKAIETPDVGYAVVHGTSRPIVERMGLTEAREILGYEPLDSAVDFFGRGSETGSRPDSG
jgi:uronate dehydrogenase